MSTCLRLGDEVATLQGVKREVVDLVGQLAGKPKELLARLPLLNVGVELGTVACTYSSSFVES